MNDHENYLTDGLADEDRAFAAELSALADQVTPPTAFVERLAPQMRQTQPQRSGFFASLQRWIAGGIFQRGDRSPAWGFNAVALGVIVLSVLVFGALVFGGNLRPTMVGGLPEQEATSEPPTLTATLEPTATDQVVIAVHPTATRPAGHQRCEISQFPPMSNDPTPTNPPRDQTMSPIPPKPHVVADGETLCSILQLYFLPADDRFLDFVLGINDLGSESEVAAGMTLLIPVPPPNKWQPHYDVPSVSCWNPTYTWYSTYSLDDEGNWVPCNNDPMPTEVPSILSLAEASAVAGFTAQEFTALPEGYVLYSRNASNADGVQFVGAEYRSTNADEWLTLAQRFPSTPLEEMPAFIYPYMDYAVPEPVTVGSNPGLFLLKQSPPADTGTLQNVLIWNKDDFTFWMFSSHLTRDEMIALAASVQ